MGGAIWNCQQFTNEYLQGQTIEAMACICQEECSGEITENSTVAKFASNWQMLYRSQYLYLNMNIQRKIIIIADTLFFIYMQRIQFSGHIFPCKQLCINVSIKLHREPSKQPTISGTLRRERQKCRQRFPSPKTRKGDLYLDLLQPKNLCTAGGKHCHQISSLYTWWTSLQ